MQPQHYAKLAVFSKKSKLHFVLRIWICKILLYQINSPSQCQIRRVSVLANLISTLKKVKDNAPRSGVVVFFQKMLLHNSKKYKKIGQKAIPARKDTIQETVTIVPILFLLHYLVGE